MTSQTTLGFPVSETFESLQGEGNAAGKKSLFIRFHFCNLTCSWCDTKYTWHQKSGIYQPMPAGELLSLMTRSPSKHVILTGGEPSLHPIDLLDHPEKKIHVESNGTVIPTEELDVTLLDGTALKRPPMKRSVIQQWNWVISPKYENAGQAIIPSALRWWANQDFAIFKWIIRDLNDLRRVTELCEEYGIPSDRAYVGLEGNTRESQLRGDLAESIILAGFHFSPRLHVLFWGNERLR